MNFSLTEKIIDDMQDEVDSLYNIVFLLYDYIYYKDVNYDVCKEKMAEVNRIKKSLLEQLLSFIDMYKKCEKVHTTNETIILVQTLVLVLYL